MKKIFHYKLSFSLLEYVSSIDISEGQLLRETYKEYVMTNEFGVFYFSKNDFNSISINKEIEKYSNGEDKYIFSWGFVYDDSSIEEFKIRMKNKIVNEVNLQLINILKDKADVINSSIRDLYYNIESFKKDTNFNEI